ncbi:MAG: MFS transporter [Acidimicrobiia bacterium]
MVRQFLATKWFALIFLASLASELTNSLLVHFPGYLLDLGADEVRIGTIVGVSGLASIVVRPWIGKVMDQKSRRLMIRIGTGIVVVATFSYAFIDQLGPAVVGARLLQGIGQAMSMTAFWTYIADRTPVQFRSQGIALFGISGLAPLGIAPAMGDRILASAWGYRGIFLVAAAFSLVALILAFFLERSGVNTGATTSGFLEVLRRPSLRPVWFVTLILSLGFTAAFVFVKTYVTTSGLGTIGPFFAAYALVAVTWRLTLAWVPDRIGPTRMLGPGLAAYALGVALVGILPLPEGLLIGGAITGLGHGISFPVVLSLATSRAAPGERGTTTAIFTALFDLSLFGASPLLGLIIREFGYQFMFVGTAIVVMAGMVVFLMAEKRLVIDLIDVPATAPVPHV